MKKIALVTDVPFWRNAAGCDLRVNQILKLLSGKADVVLFYTGKISSKDRKKECFQHISTIYEVVFWKQQIALFIKDFVQKYVPFLRPFLKKMRRPGSLKTRESIAVKNVVEEKLAEEKFDVLWVEYVWLTYLFDLADSSVVKVVDTHDVQFDRCESFKKIGLEYDFQITKDEELCALNKADFVLAINHRDYENLYSHLKDKVVEYPYLPSTENIFAPEPCTEVKRIAFIGSAIDFNIKSLNWFLTNVWPIVLKDNPNVELHVYGKVSAYCRKLPSVYLHGYVEKYEDIYKNNQIFVNPILMGGGLKIKCVEALMYGKPLVTTSVGAQGLEEGVNEAFLVADDVEGFSSHINSLLHSKQQIDALSKKAVSFMESLRIVEKKAERVIESFL